MTALIPQLKANRLTEESNELTRKGNAIAEAAYNLQKWDDCHDRPVSMAIQGVLYKPETYFPQDLQRSDICQNVSSLIRKDVVARKLQHDRRALNRTALPSIHLTHTGGSSILNSSPTSLDNWMEPIFFSIVVCFILCDVEFRLHRPKRRTSESLISDKHLKLTCESEWWAEGRAILPFLPAHVFSQIFLAVTGDLNINPASGKACGLALLIFNALFVVVDFQIQQSRKDSTPGQDVECYDHAISSLRSRSDLAECDLARTLVHIGTSAFMVWYIYLA